ncbi:MAG: apolipoprotein N-acyltransferase [Candidatus Eiseniibacteriota bacterium]
MALAIASGALLGVAFLPVPLGCLAWVACVPLLFALDAWVRDGARYRDLFGLGYAFGLAFFLIGVHWIALLSDVAITVPWLKYPAWALAAAYLALFPGLATLLAGWLARRSRAGLALTFPIAMLGAEELRASGEMGFPWFQPGYTQHAYVPVIQLASLGSVSLVTLWLLAVNALVWRALTGDGRLRAAIGAGLLLALPWAWGLRVLDAAPKPQGPATMVALVQGNIPGEMKWSGKHQREILDRFLDLSRRAVTGERAPAIVIWPETATGSYLRHQADQLAAVAAFASRAGVPVFSGMPDWRFGADDSVEYVNAAALIGPAGVRGPIYAKRHLVPFGERMPFQSMIPAMRKIQLGQAEWTAGAGPVLFPSAAGPFACLVCFESIFPDLARDDVRRGARWLVNITNDEWFGNSAALYQHAAMAPFRAVENHVPLARCANTGLTLVADAYGRVTHRLPVWTPTVLTAPLGPPGLPTPYTRWGDWPGLLAGLALVALAIDAARRRAPGTAR